MRGTGGPQAAAGPTDGEADVSHAMRQFHTQSATGVYAAAYERRRVALVVAPHRSDTVLTDPAETAPSQCDCHIQTIAQEGQIAWQQSGGYNMRTGMDSQNGTLEGRPRRGTALPL